MRVTLGCLVVTLSHLIGTYDSAAVDCSAVGFLESDGFPYGLTACQTSAALGVGRESFKFFCADENSGYFAFFDANGDVSDMDLSIYNDTNFASTNFSLTSLIDDSGECSGAITRYQEAYYHTCNEAIALCPAFEMEYSEYRDNVPSIGCGGPIVINASVVLTPQSFDCVDFGIDASVKVEYSEDQSQMTQTLWFRNSCEGTASTVTTYQNGCVTTVDVSNNDILGYQYVTVLSDSLDAGDEDAGSVKYNIIQSVYVCLTLYLLVH